MSRFLTALTAMFVLSSPAAAQSAESYYRATLQAASAPGKVISSDVLWAAHDNVLEAPMTGDVARRVCAVLAHNVGPITAFQADGKPISVEDLGYCNKYARKTK